MRRIDVQNHSTDTPDAILAEWCAAITRQTFALAAHWGVDQATLTITEPGSPVPDTHWLCTIADHSDVNGALGYHDDEGRPSLHVFTADCIADGASPSVDLSHEVLEALVDPECVWGADLGSGLWVAREVGDPVEADEDGYEIDGVLVSDFVLPAWFDPSLRGPYDYHGVLAHPLSMAPGGYVSIQRHGKWVQKFAPSHAGNAKSRRSLKARRHTVRAARRIVAADHPLAS